MEIIFWVILVPLGGTGLVAWLYRTPEHGAVPAWLRSSWSRFLGQYHRFQKGQLLEPGEQECYRGSVLGVRAHSVERNVMIADRALCIVTRGSVLIQNQHGLQIRLLGSDIRSVRAHRDYDQEVGFSYWVVMERVGSAEHQPEGDLAFRCDSQEQSLALCSAIESITTVAVLT